MRNKQTLIGRYSPKNYQKYRGDPTNVTYRSSWERRVMKFLDYNPNVLEWSSEEIVIPYRSPIDLRIHRYFPDFYVKFRDKGGNVKEMLWEIKPEHQTKMPEKKGPVNRRLIQEAVTWAINEKKWKTAKAFCEDRGWEFRILTEVDLFDK